MSDDWDRKQAEKYHARVSSAAYALGALQAVLADRGRPDREQRLAEAVEELRISLLGDQAELEALNARRAAEVDALLGRGVEGGGDRG